MALQTHIHRENLADFPMSSQDYLFMGFNNIDYNDNNILLLNNNLQQQKQYMVHLEDIKRRKSYANDNIFAFSQPSKRQKLVINSATTTTNATTTASTATSESEYNMSMNISHSLSLQLEKQRMEMDKIITLQHERLKLALQEQRRQQLTAIIKKLEEKALQLLKQKDDEIKEATKKTIELQEIMKKHENEKQVWQRVASQNEAMMFSLSNTLEQLQQQQHQQQQEDCSSSSNVVDDNESFCNFIDNHKNSTARETTTTTKESFCKVCNCRSACILMLPCRHMCSCTICDGLLDCCPVCKTPKVASFEALIS